MAQPEKLSFWDRIFNRYRKEIIEEGSEQWNHFPYGTQVLNTKVSYTRNFVKYKVVDRITGSETIEKRYLDC